MIRTTHDTEVPQADAEVFMQTVQETRMTPITTEQLVSECRHRQDREFEVTDHEGGTWTLSYCAAEPDSEEEDTIDFSGPGINDDEVDVGAFISLHAQYTWTIDAMR